MCINSICEEDIFQRLFAESPNYRKSKVSILVTPRVTLEISPKNLRVSYAGLVIYSKISLPTFFSFVKNTLFPLAMLQILRMSQRGSHTVILHEAQLCHTTQQTIEHVKIWQTVSFQCPLYKILFPVIFPWFYSNLPVIFHLTWCWMIINFIARLAQSPMPAHVFSTDDNLCRSSGHEISHRRGS